MNTELQHIPLRDLKEHPDNPRKHFDPVSLTDLAASILVHGILTPLLVRPNHQGFQVIGGHRRFRAAHLAELEAVPAIVHELDDRAALELMVLDNLQRDDLHPLEEAEGYAALMKEAGYDVDAIAQRISKSTKYVYDRIKLLQLVPLARKIFLDGEITVGHAILLARLSTADQARAMGIEADDPTYFLGGGLFEHESVEDDPGLDLDDEREPRKAVSVRELETWINKNVRFRPEEVDLPNLFPETAAALATAAEEELKVVKITYDHQLRPATKEEGERTYSRDSWKRADGEVDHEDYLSKSKPSKTCEHSVLGVIVAGRGRGHTLKVCVAKKKCTVHWKEEQQAANERGAPNGAGTTMGATDYAAKEQARRQREAAERARDEAERERWKKAAPKLQEALATKLSATPATKLIDLIVDRLKAYGTPAKSKFIDRGKTLEEAIQFAAFLVLSPTIVSWDATRRAPAELKKYGIDAKKIVDQVAPREKPKKEAAAKAAKKKAPAKKRKKGFTPNLAAGARALKKVQDARKSL